MRKVFGVSTESHFIHYNENEGQALNREFSFLPDRETNITSIQLHHSQRVIKYKENPLPLFTNNKNWGQVLTGCCPKAFHHRVSVNRGRQKIDFAWREKNLHFR